MRKGKMIANRTRIRTTSPALWKTVMNTGLEPQVSGLRIWLLAATSVI